MKEAWYNKKWAIILLHSVAWITLFSLPYLLRPTYNATEQPHKPAFDETLNFILARVNDIFLVSFFYLNAMVLFPQLLYKKKQFFYILAVIGCFALISLEGGLLRKHFQSSSVMPFEWRKHLFFTFFVFLFILACSVTYRTIRDRIVADNIAQEKENEFLKTELSLLRSQVSPHFMFNVLNNMVALARKQSDQLEPSLIKLSSLMRYMLYETDEEKVSLERETEYLQSYIDLQQQRFGKKVIIHTTFQHPDKTYFIEPMLLIPFVENAFKHGTGMIENAMIDIELSAAEGQLQFVVKNKYNAASNEIKDKASGIGLANVGRRLELLYHNDHELTIEKNNDLFTVKLQIALS